MKQKVYGLKYSCPFDPISDLSTVAVYTIEILQKNHTGEVIQIKGSTVPALHNYDTDDPKAPIKGSSLAMALINDGALPLNDLFSTDDDTFKVRLTFRRSSTLTDTANVAVVPGIRGQTNITINKPLSVTGATYFILDGIKYAITTISSDGTNTYITTYGTPIGSSSKTFTLIYDVSQVLFEGFLVQDDCSEPLLDYTHEINLSANDNLGLLKDVSLDKANIFSLSFTSTSVPFGADFGLRQFLFSKDIQPYIAVGNRIEITGTPIDGIYTINKIVIDSGTGAVGLYVDEPIPQNYVGTTIYKMWVPANLLNKTPLSTIIRMCLSVTGLDLNTNVYSQINEVSQDISKCFLEQTLIDPQTFLKSDTEYTDCYDVLTKILSRFNMTLFQAYGAWNIVRWDELRYFNNRIQGFSYDKDFNSLGTITLPAINAAGIDESTLAETGILQKICRPFLFDKETFNYTYPRQLLRNFDLQQLGSLIRTYTTGSGDNLQKVSEYNAPYWYDSGLAPQLSEFFIRITTDSLDNEIERVIAARHDNIKSYQIEVNQGDSFKISFSFKTENSQSAGSSFISFVFVVELNDGITRKFFHNPDLTTGDTMWQTPAGFVYQMTGGNSNQWQSVEIDCSKFPIPYDGLLYVYLSGVADVRNNASNFTLTKDIRFEYTARINESTKIIGQTHLQSQSGVIKNTEDVEIFIDSSPRNSIAGTLFLDEKVGLLQKRTEYWRHPYKATQKIKLGDLITYEQLFWRRKPRTILEGTLYGLISGGAHISLLSVFKYSFFPDLNFVFGKMEIDYKNNKVDGTLWEIWDDNETDGNLPERYLFNYLYSTT